MKHPTTFIRTLAVIIPLTFAAVSPCAAATNAPAQRIGVYDSRAIAYAHFSSDAHQRKLRDLVQDAKAARDAGDNIRAEKLSAELRREQEQIHLQGFSTAPVDGILAGMTNRIAEIRKETGVSALVSKWDEPALAKHKGAERVDVTERLLRDFTLDDKQRKTVEELMKKPPVPLDRAQELMRKGEL
jgi:hypothetical protein